MDAKAKNVHLSLYDNVTDISNLLGEKIFTTPDTGLGSILMRIKAREMLTELWLK